ncbi:hypothetical protein WR25_04184 [Diploscapter pachys]|uniref:ABC-2 type transporter transmembrane domain-containing protein n=1 Tax=Diploscapter pachys TaxID=2018661 RepID=A0A2A2L5Y2_9BILA|nr:hypothetical protein WR25_04184 [Diploscapter pachys]
MHLAGTPPEGLTAAQNNLPLVRSLLGNSTDIYVSLWDRNQSSMSYRLAENLIKPPGIGMRCIDEQLLRLGGFSLGHTSLRAEPMDLPAEKKGWRYLRQSLKSSAEILQINFGDQNSNMTDSGDSFTSGIGLNMLIDALLEKMEAKENIKVWFNNKIWPAIAIQNNEITNALLRTISSEDSSKIGIFTYNNPMNVTVKDALDATAMQKIVSMRSFLLISTLCMIPAAFIQIIIDDRFSESLHLQIISGLKKKTYWIAQFPYDMGVYTMSIMALMLIYFSFDVKE